MNTREIAQAVNKDERTVQRWVKKLSVNVSSISDKMSVSSPMRPADYTLDETVSIIEIGLGKNAALIFAENAKQKQSVSIPMESVLSSKDIELIARVVSMTVSETVKQLDGRMTKIESKIEERQALLPAPDISPRNNVNMIMREYASHRGVHYSAAFGELYTKFNYTHGCNVNASAKNRKVAIIDYIESEGLIESLEAVALKYFAAQTA